MSRFQAKIVGGICGIVIAGLLFYLPKYHPKIMNFIDILLLIFFLFFIFVLLPAGIKALFEDINKVIMGDNKDDDDDGYIYSSKDK